MIAIIYYHEFFNMEQKNALYDCVLRNRRSNRGGYVSDR